MAPPERRATGTEAALLARLCPLAKGDSPDAFRESPSPPTPTIEVDQFQFLQVRPTDPSESSRDDVSHGDWRGHRPGPSRELSPLPSLPLAVSPLCCRDPAVPESRFDSLRRGTGRECRTQSLPSLQRTSLSSVEARTSGIGSNDAKRAVCATSARDREGVIGKSEWRLECNFEFLVDGLAKACLQSAT